MVFEVQDNAKAADCQSKRTRNGSDYNIRFIFFFSVIQIRTKANTNEIIDPEHFTKEDNNKNKLK